MAAIINFSEAFIIGVHSLVIVAHSKDPVNLEAIAEKGNIMKNHASKVLQILVKKGLMNSYKGPSGGFILIKEPKDINMLALYEMIEGPVSMSECPRGKAVCPFGNCLMGGVASKLSGEVKEYLGNKTLEDLLNGATFIP